MALLIAWGACGGGVAIAAPSGAAVPATTAAAPPLLPVSDFARHATLGSPALSPGGQYLAVSVREEDNDANSSRYQLAVLELPSLKPLAKLNMAPYTQPARIAWVSPTRLIVEKAREIGTLDAPSLTGEIVALNFDGSQQRILYSFEARGSGANSAMLRMPYGYSEVVGVPSSYNGHLYLQIAPAPEIRNGQSYDTYRTLLFDVDTVSGYPVEIASIDKGNMRFVVADGKPWYAEGSNDNNDPVVYRTTDAGKTWSLMPASVVGKGWSPLALSPDRQHVYALDGSDGGPGRLVEARLDGGESRVLASDPFFSVAAVRFTPEPRQPYAALIEGGRPRWITVGDTPWGDVLTALGTQFSDQFVAIAGMSRDGNTLLVAAASDRSPGVYALLDRTSMHLRPLYQTAPWIDPARMAATTPIRYRNRSGTDLAGYLTLPAGRAPKNLPLVMLPHGGPIGPADAWFYDPDVQFLANRGYAVLKINYRGSGGRGDAFLKSGYRQWGTGMIDDMIDGVRWAIAQGAVDPARICVYGGSYGGYAALMLPIRAPDLFKCAIDYVGVTDLTIQFDRSDTRRSTSGRVYFKQAMAATREEARAISPLYLLEQLKVPVLIASGGADKRVPIQNADDLRDALDKAHKPYEWLMFPKEGHGFFTETHRAEFYTRMQDFLAKYAAAGSVAAPGAATAD
jgi:dipeptidyl aminopeptidase/acylaminoacyl peptidase